MFSLTNTKSLTDMPDTSGKIMRNEKFGKKKSVKKKAKLHKNN